MEISSGSLARSPGSVLPVNLSAWGGTEFRVKELLRVAHQSDVYAVHAEKGCFYGHAPGQSITTILYSARSSMQGRIVHEAATHRPISSSIGRFRGRLSRAPANKLPNISAWMSTVPDSDDRYRESPKTFFARRNTHGRLSGRYGVKSYTASPAAASAAALQTRGVPTRPAVRPQTANAPMSSTTFKLGSKSGPMTHANARIAPKSRTNSVITNMAHPASAATMRLLHTARKLCVREDPSSARLAFARTPR